MTIADRTAIRKGSIPTVLSVLTLGDMGRRIDVDNMVGAAEIAQRLGVKRPQVVHDWRRRHEDFPEPVAKLQQALVWNWPDVERWAKQTGRL